MNIRHFDVIFSGWNLSENEELRQVMSAQERGDAAYVREIRDRLDAFRADLRTALGPPFSVAFGLSTTSAIAMMLGGLPGRVVTTTKEFPPIVKLFDNMGKRCIGLIDTDAIGSSQPFYRPLQEDDAPGEPLLLLLSHVSYTDGEDLLETLLPVLEELDLLRNRPVHLLLDGAHAIGNHAVVQDIPALLEAFGARLELSGFTYVFDFHKWVRGLMGQAVVVSTDPALCRRLDCVFPNTLDFDSAWIEFDAPVSVSFNPALIFWLMNLRHFAPRLFDRDILRENRRLTRYFLDALGRREMLRAGLPTNNNLLSLDVINPERTHQRLLEAGIHTHLMGGKRIRTRMGVITHKPLVRLAFSSLLVTEADIDDLLDTLAAIESGQPVQPALLEPALLS